MKDKEYLKRHEHCVRLKESYAALERSPGYYRENGLWYTPSGHLVKVQAVCDHPEDGHCSSWVDEKILQDINERESRRTGKPVKTWNEDEPHPDAIYPSGIIREDSEENFARLDASDKPRRAGRKKTPRGGARISKEVQDAIDSLNRMTRRK